jgi:hypothetical protein
VSRNDGCRSANGCAAKLDRQALIVVLHANREHRRDAYATLGSATYLTPPTVHVVRHSTKLLSLTLSLIDFLNSSLAIAWRRFAEMSKLQARHFVPDYYEPVPPGQKPLS